MDVLIAFFLLCGIIWLVYRIGVSAFRAPDLIDDRDTANRADRRPPNPVRPSTLQNPAPPAEKWRESRRPERPASSYDSQPTPAGAQGRFSAATAAQVRTPQILSGPAYIVDGDTIRIKKTQIRLFGIDAPEMNHPFGKKAKWALVHLCKGQHVRAEILEKDAHGRTVAKCTLPDGRDLSAEMVKAGMAIDWPKFSGGLYTALEVPGVRKKLWLADARQKGRMHVWEAFEARQQQGAK